MRKIYASRETAFVASTSPNKKVKVFSFFPVDRADCSCQKMIQEWKIKLGQSNEKDRKSMIENAKFLTCPRSRVGLKRFKVVCKICREVQGFCWATDASLVDWCDFHYVLWTNGLQWFGCFTPHVSAITQELCLECCCGNDTRDFRANMTLNQKVAERYETRNRIGRKFNRVDSKFATIRVLK